jgi:hypothetical protein
MLLAMGAVGWESWLAGRGTTARRWLAFLGWALIALGLTAGVVLTKPLAPINSRLWEITSAVNGEAVEMIGWDDLTDQVAEVYAAIPAEEKPLTVILAGNYGEAGALNLYGPAYDLPPVISGANSLWRRGYGSFEPQTVIAVGFDLPYARSFFRDCQFAGKVTNRYGVENEESTRHTGLYICREPHRPWAEMWAEMQWFQ